MIWRIQSTSATVGDLDFNYNLFTVALQAHLELWLGIIAANLPTLAPLLARYVRPQLRTYFKKGASGGKSVPRTFGSAEKPSRREKFDRLDDDNSSEVPLEPIDTPSSHYMMANTIESGKASPSLRPHTITMRSDIEVTVDNYGLPSSETPPPVPATPQNVARQFQFPGPSFR
jgi:hypothetical protein